MKRTNIIKITLDIIMTVVFVLLYNKRVIYGLTFHEVAGLAIGAIFMVHIALNWRWVRNVTSNILRKKISLKTKIGFVVDVLLLLAMMYIVISGILISKIVFPNLGIGNMMIFKSTHMSISYFALLLAGIHLGLHWDWVINTFKRIFRITRTKKVWSYMAKAAMIIVLVSGIYSIYSTNYFTRLPIVGEVISGEQRPGSDKGMKVTFNTDEMKGQSEGRINNTGETSNKEGAVRGKPGDGKGFPDANPLNVLATNLGIIAVFTILTFYIEKLLIRKRAREKIA